MQTEPDHAHLAERLARVHRTLAERRAAFFEDDEEMRSLLLKPNPAWSDADFLRVEEASGVAVPALMRTLYGTAWATPNMGHDGVRGYPGFAWPGSVDELLDRQASALRLAEGGDLPARFLVLSLDEDYLALFEDGSVVQVCSNEANVEDEEPMGVTSYDEFVAEYCRLMEAHLEREESGAAPDDEGDGDEGESEDDD